MATPFQSKRLQSAEKSADPSHDYGELESLPEDLRPEKRGGIWTTGGESSTDVVGELFPGCGSFQDVEKIVVSSFTMIQPECAIEASPIHHRLLDYTSSKHYCT